jgi:hypothetical protein
VIEGWVQSGGEEVGWSICEQEREGLEGRGWARKMGVGLGWGTGVEGGREK